MAGLFDPLPLAGRALRNRIALSPMCQYSAVDGLAQDWHFVHLGRFAAAGLGLIMVEATHVSARGRITPACLGLWSEAHRQKLRRIVDFIRGVDPDALIGIQLAHAGRKGSTDLPWRGGKPLAGSAAWATCAPSAAPHADGWPVPEPLDTDGLARIKAEFIASARYAVDAGFDVVELHAAHGYLLHQFLSPVANRRDDGYGGTTERRMRFPLEVVEAVRRVWPADRPLGVRVSATDYLPGEGADVPDAVRFASALKPLGVDFVDVSGGGISPRQQIKTGPGYQVGYAERIRRETGLTTFAVGRITEPHQADAIIRDGRADAVMMARGMLNDPLWCWRAADALGGTVHCPPQYLRGRRIDIDTPRTVTPRAV